MLRKKALLSIACVTATTGVALLAPLSAASASTGAAAPAGAPKAHRSCGTVDRGTLCIEIRGTSVRVSYHKSAGAPITQRLGYGTKGVDTWGAWTTQKVGQDRSVDFPDAVDKCHDLIGVMDVKGQGRFHTGLIGAC